MYKFFLLFLLILKTSAYGVDYSNIGIVDNEEKAKASRLPKSLTISYILRHIEEDYDLARIHVLDFSRNNISRKGATEIFKFARRNTPNLKKLDLSENNISEKAQDDEEFNGQLIKLLKLDKLEKIKLKGNNIGSTCWLNKIADVVGIENAKKIKIGL